jgi:hypothetical protein
MSEPNEELTGYLAGADLPYRALSPLGGTSARVRFTGMFQGQAVVWDAEILTLAAYDRRQARLATARAVSRAWRQFIEIGAQSAQGRALSVGLAVPRIDAATVLRCIIMIRNYKRLWPGRHEFGDSQVFTAE